MNRRNMLFAVAGATLLPDWLPALSRNAVKEGHIAWVVQVLRRVQTIKPGMTRAQLLNVFTTEGGLSIGLERTFVSRDCHYFKVNVAFHVIGRRERDDEGRVTLVEDNRDIIETISEPFLQWSMMD